MDVFFELRARFGLQIFLGEDVSGRLGFGGHVEHFAGSVALLKAEFELDEHSFREKEASEPAGELLSDLDGIAADYVAPHVRLGVAGESAGACFGYGSESAAGRKAHDRLFLMFDKRGKRVGAAGFGEGVDLRAVRYGSAERLVYASRRLGEFVRIQFIRHRRHFKNHRRNAVAVDEAPPLVFGDIPADEKRKCRIVHGALALYEQDIARIKGGLPLSAGTAFDCKRIVPPCAVQRAVELPCGRQGK